MPLSEPTANRRPVETQEWDVFKQSLHSFQSKTINWVIFVTQMLSNTILKERSKSWANRVSAHYNGNSRIAWPSKQWMRPLSGLWQSLLIRYSHPNPLSNKLSIKTSLWQIDALLVCCPLNISDVSQECSQQLSYVWLESSDAMIAVNNAQRVDSEFEIHWTQQLLYNFVSARNHCLFGCRIEMNDSGIKNHWITESGLKIDSIIGLKLKFLSIYC